MFDGRELTETTVHEYEGGLLVRSVTTREAAWTELDQAEMFALAEYRQSLCPLHHGPLEDCQTAEDRGGPEFTPQAIRCRAEYDKIAAQETDARMKDRPGSLMWLAVKKER